jgi:hypothetical protein
MIKPYGPKGYSKIYDLWFDIRLALVNLRQDSSSQLLAKMVAFLQFLNITAYVFEVSLGLCLAKWKDKNNATFTFRDLVRARQTTFWPKDTILRHLEMLELKGVLLREDKKNRNGVSVTYWTILTKQGLIPNNKKFLFSILEFIEIFIRLRLTPYGVKIYDQHFLLDQDTMISLRFDLTVDNNMFENGTDLNNRLKSMVRDKNLICKDAFESSKDNGPGERVWTGRELREQEERDLALLMELDEAGALD